MRVRKVMRLRDLRCRGGLVSELDLHAAGLTNTIQLEGAR